MLEKLHQLFIEANNLQPHEDSYTFRILASEKEWLLTIEHSYKNKIQSHPISTVYSKHFNEITEEILSEIKEKFIKRQFELIKLREKECEEKLEIYRRSAEEIANRMIHLQKLKSL